MTKATTLVQDIEDLVSLPDVYLRLRDLMDDPCSSIDDFTRIIQMDPALAARVLKMANSAFFGFSAKIDKISRAINIMGVSQLHDLVLSTSVTSVFKGMRDEVMDMEKFWGSSVHCGVLARLLAAECHIIDSDRLFVTGLLHDIGHLVMYKQFPQESAELLQRSEQETLRLENLEQQMLGFDAAELGAELLVKWNLPESFIMPLRHQNMPEVADKFRLDACILHIAKKLCSDQEWSYEDVSAEMTVALEVTDLSEEQLRFIVREASLHFEETRTLLLPIGLGSRAA